MLFGLDRIVKEGISCLNQACFKRSVVSTAYSALAVRQMSKTHGLDVLEELKLVRNFDPDPQKRRSAAAELYQQMGDFQFLTSDLRLEHTRTRGPIEQLKGDVSLAGDNRLVFNVAGIGRPPHQTRMFEFVVRDPADQEIGILQYRQSDFVPDEIFNLRYEIHPHHHGKGIGRQLLQHSREVMQTQARFVVSVLVMDNSVQFEDTYAHGNVSEKEALATTFDCQSLVDGNGDAVIHLTVHNACVIAVYDFSPGENYKKYALSKWRNPERKHLVDHVYD